VNRALDDIGLLVENLRTMADQTAHDLRAPMGRLSRALRVAQDAEPGEAQASAIVTARVELDRILALMDGLLEIAHAGADGPQGFAEVDIGDVTTRAVELFRAVAEDAGVALIARTGEAVVIGDSVALMRVAANLLDNSIKFTPRGGEVTIETGVEGDTAFLEVTDTGPGIPAAEREAIFDRLKRLPRDRDKPGMGLGLAWVKAAIGRHRGEVRALVRDGGAVFRVELPRA
jgi:signal transduction histidine kinase